MYCYKWLWLTVAELFITRVRQCMKGDVLNVATVSVNPITQPVYERWCLECGNKVSMNAIQYLEPQLCRGVLFNDRACAIVKLILIIFSSQILILCCYMCFIVMWWRDTCRPVFPTFRSGTIVWKCGQSYL